MCRATTTSWFSLPLQVGLRIVLCSLRAIHLVFHAALCKQNDISKLELVTFMADTMLNPTVTERRCSLVLLSGGHFYILMFRHSSRSNPTVPSRLPPPGDYVSARKRAESQRNPGNAVGTPAVSYLRPGLQQGPHTKGSLPHVFHLWIVASPKF